MFEFAKKAQWLQTQVVKAIARTAPAIGHNIDKIQAIKKAFHFVNMESVPGDYLEFGMYEGTSFIGAFECHMQTRQPYSPPRKFWGFDSFEGFKYSSNADAHPFFQEGEFKSSYDSTRARIARHFGKGVEWTVTPGFLEDTIAGKTPENQGCQRAAVVFIDVDLGKPASLALNFVRRALRNGSIIILDDYFAYRGSATDGVAGAFETFKEQNPNLVFRRLFDYGYGGQGFVLAAGAAEDTAVSGTGAS